MLKKKTYEYQDYRIEIEYAGKDNLWDAYVEHMIYDTNEAEIIHLDFDHEPSQDEIHWALCLEEGI